MLKLTETSIRDAVLKTGQKDRLIFDGKRPGLGLRITPRSKIFLHQWRNSATGEKRREPLGTWPTLTLEKARQAVEARAGDIARGIDPAAEREKRKAEAEQRKADAALTFDHLIDDWEKLHLNNRSANYAAEAPRALRIGFAPLLRRSARRLDKADVLPLLDALVKAGSASMAEMTAAYGRACFGWAVKRGTVTSNPFTNLPPMNDGAGERDRVLTDAELPAIWRAAEAEGGRYGAIVRLLLLTGARKSEVSGMRWSELADDFTTWTLPGARTKNGNTLVLPLAEPARAILRAAPRVGPVVFGDIKGRPFAGWTPAKARLDTAAPLGVPWVIHDLRRTLATGLQRLGVRLEVTEAVLNHTGGSRAGIVGVYQRHDWAAEKRAALDAWAAHVTALVAGEAPAENVTALAGRKARRA